MKTRISVAVICSLLCIFIVVTLFDRNPPRTEIVGEVTKDTVARGEMLEPRYRITVARECEGWGSSVITSVDTDWTMIVRASEIRKMSRKIGRQTIALPPIQIPDGAPLGRAEFRSEAEFYCDLIEKLFPLTVRYPPIPFTITERTDVAPAH